MLEWCKRVARAGLGLTGEVVALPLSDQMPGNSRMPFPLPDAHPESGKRNLASTDLES